MRQTANLRHLTPLRFTARPHKHNGGDALVLNAILKYLAA
jgi:hypothetical protein